jgi:hypothetical protein
VYIYIPGFWFLWGTIILIGISCFIGCYRACQSRRRARYVILGQNQPQFAGYGSVVVTANGQHVYNTNGQYGQPVTGSRQAEATAPVAPPAYASTYPQDVSCIYYTCNTLKLLYNNSFRTFDIIVVTQLANHFNTKIDDGTCSSCCFITLATDLLEDGECLLNYFPLHA